MSSPKSRRKAGAKSPNRKSQAGTGPKLPSPADFFVGGDDKTAPVVSSTLFVLSELSKAWIQAVLMAHNEKRAAHWTPPLVAPRIALKEVFLRFGARSATNMPGAGRSYRA